MNEDKVQAAARSLAYDHWPLATTAERAAWANTHWQEYVMKAQNALAAALAQSPEMEEDADLPRRLRALYRRIIDRRPLTGFDTEVLEQAADALLSIPSPSRAEFKDGDPLVTELIWEVDRAVKQATRENGNYDTVIRHILNKHLHSQPLKLDISKEWCMAAAEREGDHEVGAGILAADPVEDRAEKKDTGRYMTPEEIAADKSRIGDKS